jgi:hypothetical protein
MRQTINEVPTRQVRETETSEAWKEGLYIKQEPRLGDLTLCAKVERVQLACFSRKVSVHGYRGAKDLQQILP